MPVLWCNVQVVSPLDALPEDLEDCSIALFLKPLTFFGPVFESCITLSGLLGFGWSSILWQWFIVPAAVVVVGS